MVAVVIPTEQYDLTNDELDCCGNNRRDANPACVPHLGVRLTRSKAGGEVAGDLR